MRQAPGGVEVGEVALETAQGPATPEELSEPLTTRRFTGLALAALLAPLNSTIIAVALPSIAGELEHPAALVTRWLVTSYLVVSIVAQSPAGKLGDLWGISRVLTLGRALFGIGALLAAFSPALQVLAAGRVLMALGGAFTIPPVFALLRNSVPLARRGRVFGVFGAIMGAAAAAGPVIGGFLTTRYGWHSVFIVNIPVVLLSFLFEPPRNADPGAITARESVGGALRRFDFGGTALLGASVLLLVIAVECGGALAIAGALAAIALFAFHELRTKEPVLDVRLFRRPAFAAGGAIVALQNLAMYAMLFLLPFFLAGRGASPTKTGGMLLVFTTGMVLASALGGRLSDAVGAKLVACTGALTATGGAALFVILGEVSVVSLVLMGAGIGLSGSPSQAAAMSAVSATEAGVASGALATLRYAGGVAGSGLVALLVTGGLEDRRLLVFPAVLFASALVALALPGRHEAGTSGSRSRRL